MSQLSLFSADQTAPSAADLAGLLAAAGQVVAVGGQARVSVVVADEWRADAIAAMIAGTGLIAQRGISDEGSPVVGTAPSPALLPLAQEWTRGAVKLAPPTWVPGPRAVRLWALASGRADDEDVLRYELGLDPHSPESYSTLATALMRTGVAPTLIGTRGSHPALRVSGRRRLTRLVEMIGEPPVDPAAYSAWPLV
ncbi:hypothetical protein P0W64_03010 [Tsukamurella sp. 8F]|uniref:hypothetical protein n=1 Tax=unclassified Tsukamurella TaxID=2633480 RepID=UPI0023B99D59|nr:MULTISPECIES: hypothetical protein [unclassified Tsukamurella]MDF0529572.1 hypothetical protein [Tsukamurella sp. 8J]MDF0585740.1 hypothetical protein [Tsukamurella sp. 8F]